MKKVECVNDPELDKLYPSRWSSKAEIKINSGRTFFSRVDYPKGDPENPLTWDELIEKFYGLARHIYTKDKLDRIINEIRNMDSNQNLRSLANILLLGN